MKSSEKTKGCKKVNGIKDVEKNLVRMYEGRRIREEKNECLARGYKKQDPKVRQII